MVEVCASGHSMRDAYVREDGRRECKMCMRMRVRSSRLRREKQLGPGATHVHFKRVPMLKPDDVPIVVGRETAGDLLVALLRIARGTDRDSGRAAAWLYRALKAEMDGQTSHLCNEAAREPEE